MTKIQNSPDDDRPSRGRVGIVAYAFHPDHGSEQGVGWEWAQAAARVRPVTVYTRFDSDARAEQEATRLNLDLRVVRVKTPLDRWRNSGKLRYPRYAIWLALTRAKIAMTKCEQDLVLLHHVTYASDWLPSCITGHGLPTVWGPVGGSTYTPVELKSTLSKRTRAKEAAREKIGRISRASIARSTIRNADKSIALNPETASSLSKARAKSVVLAPNVILHKTTPIVNEKFTAGQDKVRQTAVFAGRLLDWKGVQYAIESIGNSENDNWQLKIFGDGPYRRHLEAQARSTRSPNLVQFEGHVDRQKLQIEFQRADAFLFPSLHDSSPWSVAEAAVAGLPVLCFPQGGASLLAGECANIIDSVNPITSIRAHLERIAGSGNKKCQPPVWDESRVVGLVSEIYTELLTSTAAEFKDGAREAT